MLQINFLHVLYFLKTSLLDNFSVKEEYFDFVLNISHFFTLGGSHSPALTIVLFLLIFYMQNVTTVNLVTVSIFFNKIKNFRKIRSFEIISLE